MTRPIPLGDITEDGLRHTTAPAARFPIDLITGEPPTGLASDNGVVGTWRLGIASGQWGARRLASRTPGHPLSDAMRPVERRAQGT